MKCRKSKLVSAYFDNELAEKEKIRLEAHLRGCRSCSSRFEAYTKVRRTFSAAGRETAPAWFPAKVMARISDSKPSRSFVFPVLVRFAEVTIVLAMIAVGVISGGFLVNGNHARHAGALASSFSLEVFDPAPPDSVGGAYLAMTEANNAE